MNETLFLFLTPLIFLCICFLSEKVDIEYSLTVNVEDAATKVRQIERLIFRVLGLFQKLGLPPQIDRAIELMQRFIMTARMVQLTTSLMMASNPFTAAFGVVGLIGTAAEFGSGSILEGY